MSEPLRKELLDILACPSCRKAVRQEDDFIQCLNPACGLRYPIREGIPVMLIEEAETTVQTGKASRSAGPSAP